MENWHHTKVNLAAVPRLTRREHRARRLARDLGLFLLIEPTPGGSRWTLLSQTTGAQVLVYSTATGRWSAGGKRGALPWREAIELAGTMSRAATT